MSAKIIKTICVDIKSCKDYYISERTLCIICRDGKFGIAEKHEITAVGSGAGGVCGGQGGERESEAGAAVYCGGGGGAETAGTHGDV